MVLQSTVVDEEELRELIEHHEKIREDERKRIAREIHDELGQRLLALRIEVTLLKRRLILAKNVPNGLMKYLDRSTQLSKASVT